MLNDAPEPLRTEGQLEIYREYDPKKTYVLGCDTAEGVRSDYSVAVVLDAQELEVCAVYRSNTIRPGEFAAAVYDLGKMYQKGGRPWPLVAVERNNHGHAVILALKEIHGYPNMYQDPKDGQDGWKTTSVSRPIMIDTFIEAVEENEIRLNAKSILYECLTLVDNGGRIEAEEGENDDTIIATSIAIQIALKHGRFDLYDNLSEKILV